MDQIKPKKISRRCRNTPDLMEIRIKASEKRTLKGDLPLFDIWINGVHNGTQHEAIYRLGMK